MSSATSTFNPFSVAVAARLGNGDTGVATLLPPGSMLEYKEPTLWEQYKWAIIGVVGIALLEGLLIAGLLIEREHRKRTDLALKESEKMNASVLASLRSHVAVLDRNGKIIAVNDAWNDFARDNGAGFDMAKSSTHTETASAGSQVKYDLLGEIAGKTQVTRRTIAAIPHRRSWKSLIPRRTRLSGTTTWTWISTCRK